MTYQDILNTCSVNPFNFKSKREYINDCDEALRQYKLHKIDFMPSDELTVLVADGSLIQGTKQVVGKHGFLFSKLIATLIMVSITSALAGVFIWIIAYGLITNNWLIAWDVSLWGLLLSFALFITIYVGLTR